MNVLIEPEHMLDAQKTMDASNRFLFDLRGYLVIPNVLRPEQIEAMTAHLEQLRTDPDSLPPELRSPLSSGRY